jgi:hypothetical protein
LTGSAEVADLGITTVDELERHLGDDVVLAAGLVRCVSRDRVRQLAEELEQVRALREEIRARNAAKVAMVTAAAQASIIKGKPVPAGLESLSAADVMREGDFARRLDNAGALRDELAAGGLIFHPLAGLTPDEVD